MSKPSQEEKQEFPETIWVFETNYRVYKRDENGRSIGGPIYREHWRPHKIVDQTGRSWVLDNGLKVPKFAKERPQCFAFSELEVEQNVWMDEHRHKIAEKVHRASYDQVREIARILGYEE
jgi:hypothetical protein